MRISLFLIIALGTSVLSSVDANALELEFKQRVKFKQHPGTLTPDFRKNGRLKEYDYRKKERLSSESILIMTGESAIEGLEYALRLGYEYRDENDQRTEYTPHFEFKNSKTRSEFRSDQFIGIGFRHDFGNILGADRVRLNGYYDHYYRRNYTAKPRGNKAKDYSGHGNASELKLQLNAEFSSFRPDIYFTPKVEYRKRRSSKWLDTVNKEYEPEALDERYRLSLWVNWLTPIDGLEIYTGPSYRHENEAIRDNNIWHWEDGDSQQWDIKLEYEELEPGFEIEFKYSKYYSGLEDGLQQYKFEISYEF